MTQTMQVAIGETLASSLRVYLLDEVCIEGPAGAVREAGLPRRQGRLAFAFLASERARAVPREELLEVLWPSSPPPAWEAALASLISKLRRALARTGIPREQGITTAFGCYRLALPSGSWIDLEEAARALHEAEGALRAGRPRDAYLDSVIASSILRRPFLAGEDGEWIERQRRRLLDLRMRALDCVAAVMAWNGELVLAIRNAEEALGLDPIRELGYQRLMRLHTQAGNRAAALLVYERCRTTLAEDLGIDPSPETMAVYRECLT
jgi:DNA-binding SARP family transcriptional activator